MSTITKEAQLALLAAGSYWDIRQDDNLATPNIDESNRAPLPSGWKVLTQFDKSDSGPAAVTGYSARVYQNTTTNEIVISYAGTEFDTSSNVGTAADFTNGNIPLALGSYSSQAYRSAAVYQEVKAAGLSNSISFTGHSLGGGLASIMAVWFNRPAYVYAPAPFQRSADATQVTDEYSSVDGQNTTIPAEQIRLLPLVKAELLRKTGAVDPALASYSPSSDFLTREANVKAWAVDGELLRKTLFALNWIEGTNPSLLFNNPSNALGFMEKHSIDLHAAGLLTPDSNFEKHINKLPTALERIFDNRLYGYAVTKNQQNFLVKLIRNEIGIQSDAGAVLQAPNQMLTHFAADLQKLGTDLTGLNKAAQDAIIAQGIEWYYWQTTSYSGKEFFSQTGSLLQYTNAIGDELAGALSKADIYTKPWLQAIAAEHGAGTASFPTFGTAQQWSVATSNTTGATATALNQNKTQIMLGQNAADTLTGGNKNDSIFAGKGNDTLSGGAGNDLLYGGQGEDTYTFDGAWGKDVLLDTDGLGKVQIAGKTLGTFEGIGRRDVYAFDMGSGQYAGLALVQDTSSSTGWNAVIVQGANSANSITIRNFDRNAAQNPQSANGYLGIRIPQERKVALLETSQTGAAAGAGISEKQVRALVVRRSHCKHYIKRSAIRPYDGDIGGIFHKYRVNQSNQQLKITT